MARVLVTEKIAQRGLDRLAAAGHEVDVREGLTPDELLGAVAGAHALIIRSATKVTADVLAAGADLQVVGRAGVGLDNVDVPAATARGVMVVNAPTSNILSVAEQAMGLLLAQARNIPQAHAALVAGRWERSKWEGVELHGKVLGVVGLGRAGSLVAQRALAFGMRLLGLRPLHLGRAGQGHGGRAALARGALRRVRLHLDPHPQDARDGRPGRPRPAGQGQAGHPHRQHGTRGHHRRGGAGRGDPRRGGGRGRRSTSSPPSRRRVAPLRAGVGGGHPAPRRLDRGGPGQGRHHHRRAGRAGPGRRVRPLRGERGRHRGVRGRCGPSWPWPSSWAAFFACLHDGLPDRLDIEYQGDLAGRGHRHPHPLGAEGVVRLDHRGAGLLRERPAAGRRARASRSARPPPPPRPTTRAW